MAPQTKRGTSPSDWWENQTAYALNDDIHVQYGLEFGKDVIRPGDLIKIKNMRGVYRFRCLAHNVKLQATWIDCMDTVNGQWYSFRPEKIKAKVKPKRSRRKKTDTP